MSNEESKLDLRPTAWEAKNFGLSDQEVLRAILNGSIQRDPTPLLPLAEADRAFLEEINSIAKDDTSVLRELTREAMYAIWSMVYRRKNRK